MGRWLCLPGCWDVNRGAGWLEPNRELAQDGRVPEGRTGISNRQTAGMLEGTWVLAVVVQCAWHERIVFPMHYGTLSKFLLRMTLAVLMGLGVAPALIAEARAGNPAPSSIRVGRSCSCRSCSTVVTVSMETYVKRVLPNEWIASWNAESLKAGAVAIRSYGAWHVYHPNSSAYDICDTTCCQKYGTTQYTSTDNAVNATAGIYLVDSGDFIMRAEYSAENNDSNGADGCGNCYLSNRPSDGICLYDSVCCGTTKNGHGRGMCQWGSQRWAANRGMSYQWILNHYYSAFNWTAKNLTTGGGCGPVTIVVDNTSSGFSSSSNWILATMASDKYGANYRYRSTAALSDTANWTANITCAGNYTISAWWSQGANRSPTAPYILPNGNSAPKNQQTNGGKWNTLGSQHLATGSRTTKLSCWTTSGYVVIADAVRYHLP